MIANIVAFALSCGAVAVVVQLVVAAHQNKPNPRHKEQPAGSTVPRWLRWLLPLEPNEPSRLDVLDGVTEKEGER